MRKQMGIAARFYATTQSWDEIFHGLYMQYEEVLHQNNTELLA